VHEVFQTELDRLTCIGKNFLEAVPFRDDAWKCWDDGGIPPVLVRLENDGEASLNFHRECDRRA